jgi:malate dehydrogenase
MLGTALAQRLAERDYLDVILYDREERGVGRASDICEGAPLVGFEPRIRGTGSVADTAGSDIIIDVTGVARHPGETREDLFPKNARNTFDLVRDAVHASPESIVIVFTNPLDLVTELAMRASGLPRERVFGAATADSIRLKTFIARRLQVSARDVTALVIGSHTEDCVPIRSSITVGGIPIAHFLSDDELEAIISATKNEGGNLVRQTGRGAFIAPAVTGMDLVDAIALSKGRVVTCCVMLNGEFGIAGVCLGVPAVVSGSGIEQIVQLELTEAEQAALQHCAAGVRQGVRDLVDPLGLGAG